MTRARWVWLALLHLAWLALLAGATAVPSRSAAAPWSRFDVPDSALAGAVREARTDYENAWNALLVVELRATASRADSARRLARLERRVADAEAEALGSHLAPDALALRRRWNARQRATRIDAAVAESLATAARTARAWDAADSLYGAALVAYRALGERRREAWVLGGLGAAAFSAGRLERALERYEVALAARRALGDPRLLGNTLNDLGQACLQLDRSADACRWLREAVDVRERSGQRAGLGASLGFLGLALSGLGRPDSASACFERSLVLTSEAGDSARTLLTLVNYATTLTGPADADRAARLFDRARVIATDLEDLDRLSMIEANLGDRLRQEGRYTESLEHQDRARQLAADNPARLAVALVGTGLTRVEMGDVEHGLRALRAGLVLADSLGDDALAARALIDLAAGQVQAADYPEARRSAERALARAVASGDSTLVRDAAHVRGHVEMAAGALPAAGEWIDRALAASGLADPDRRARMLVNRGVAWQRQSRLAEAEGVYGEAMALARATGASDVQAQILTNLGDLAERRGDVPAAFARYGEALALIDSIRGRQGAGHDAIRALASRVYVHEAVIHLLGRLDPSAPDSGYAARAFTWAERARSRALLDLVEAGGRAGGAVPIGIDEVRGRLHADEALLEYSVGDSSTALWVVRRGTWRHLQLPPRSALRVRVARLRSLLADPQAATGASAVELERELYRILVAPAEPLLAGVTRLVVSPDGPLAFVPFEALLARDAVAGAPPARAFLVERFAIRYTPSASMLERDRAAPGGEGIVAVGNPAFAARAATAAGREGTPALAPLPETALELACLERFAGAQPIVLLADTVASAARVRALPQLTRASVLHFATHGDVNEAEPDRSALWFAPDSGTVPPSRLESGEVARLRLAADLVTLSACETGVGRLERGEGVLGLQRAFLAAGARSVVASLWSVNDRSTARLMEAFYRRVLVRREDRVTALVAAKRELLAAADTRSPFYWAPFVLYGGDGVLAVAAATARDANAVPR